MNGFYVRCHVFVEHHILRRERKLEAVGSHGGIVIIGSGIAGLVFLTLLAPNTGLVVTLPEVVQAIVVGAALALELVDAVFHVVVRTADVVVPAIAFACEFETTLFPAIMQGEHAAKSIIAALETIATQEEEWDTVVIIRGGGATTDLTCFDDYNLCNHCAQFPLPIITGIGHTKDVSVLDLVAFAPLKTPTAVAQYFVDGRIAQAQRLRDLEQRLRRVAENILLVRRHKIELLSQRLAMCSPERIYKMGYSLVTSGGKVVRSAQDLQSGETITTHFIDGEREAIVQ